MMFLLPIALAFADKPLPKCADGFNCWQKTCVGLGPGTTEAPRCEKTLCVEGRKDVPPRADKAGRLYCGPIPRSRR